MKSSALYQRGLGYFWYTPQQEWLWLSVVCEKRCTATKDPNNHFDVLNKIKRYTMVALENITFTFNNRGCAESWRLWDRCHPAGWEKRNPLCVYLKETYAGQKNQALTSTNTQMKRKFQEEKFPVPVQRWPFVFLPDAFRTYMGSQLDKKYYFSDCTWFNWRAIKINTFDRWEYFVSRVHWVLWLYNFWAILRNVGWHQF